MTLDLYDYFDSFACNLQLIACRFLAYLYTLWHFLFSNKERSLSMKKSTTILFSSVLTLAIASCKEKQKEPEWIVGDQNGKVRDTTTSNGSYRYFGGFWYPLIAGRISPGLYQGASSSAISKPGFRSSVRTGGFGRSGYSGS
jgi:hypothetical protein